jgi:hypothetical protein
MKKLEVVQFVITNNTDTNIELPLFKQNVAALNSFTKYSWNVTAETFGCTVSFIWINSVQYNVFHAPNINSLVASLNALGLGGTFGIETVGGNTFIYAYDNTNVYGDLWVCPLI